MSREEFEKWVEPEGYGIWSAEWNAAWTAWQARQPEIDALKAEFKEESDVVAGLFGMGLEIQKERDQLRARVAELEGERDELARQIGELTTDDKGMKILSLLTVREHDKAMIDAQGDLIARMRLALGKAVHYPECWDEINYPTLGSAINEVLSFHAAGADVRCTNENCALISPPAPMVPEGWALKQVHEGIIVSGPFGGCVAMKDAKTPRLIPEIILFKLAEHMLSAAPEGMGEKK